MELAERVSISATSLKKVPFQLLPRVVYPTERLEASLSWQRSFVESLDSTAPQLAVVLVVAPGSDSQKTLESLALQSYQPSSVTVLLPSGTDAAATLALLERFKLQGTVIAIGAEDGISNALEPVLKTTAADYFCILDSDVLLHPQALLILCKCIVKKHPELIYSNEVTLSADGETALQFFRRAPLDPISVLSTNFYGSVSVVSRELAKRAIPALGLRSQSLGVLGWGLAAEALAGSRHTEFIPLALVHRRQRSSRVEERDVYDARGVLSQYAKRLRLPLENLEQQPGSELCFRPVFRPTGGAVQVIIPFKNRAAETVLCLKSLAAQDTASELEVYLVDNGSSPEERQTVETAVADPSLPFEARTLEHRGYFNFAHLNNLGARRSVSPYILFLNNDVELTDPHTIAELRTWCAIDDAGVVGGALYYPNGKLQHAGINFSGVRPCNVTTPEQFCDVSREVNAVTFAMALVKRRVFDLVGGLDEFLCPNGFGDAVFCNEIRKQGYLVLYTPAAVGTHHESLSRGQQSEELELYEMTQAGIPISDLYPDMYARNQPTRINLVQLQAHEEPLRRNTAQHSVPFGALTRLPSRIAHRVLRAVGG